MRAEKWEPISDIDSPSEGIILARKRLIYKASDLIRVFSVGS
jgi:hypothetical protein